MGLLRRVSCFLYLSSRDCLCRRMGKRADLPFPLPPPPSFRHLPRTSYRLPPSGSHLLSKFSSSLLRLTSNNAPLSFIPSWLRVVSQFSLKLVLLLRCVRFIARLPPTRRRSLPPLFLHLRNPISSPLPHKSGLLLRLLSRHSFRPVRIWLR